MAVELTWIGHASFRLAATHVVYIDPWKIVGAPRDGNLAIVSHIHHDHCSAEDLAKVLRDDGEILAPRDAVEQIGRGYAALPGEKVTLCGVQVETLPAYNPKKRFHVRASNWLGVVVTMDGTRVYYAGDTDVIAEMGELRDIDVALLPVGGTYTMNATEAAEACRRISPAVAIPYHWGDIVGARSDADAFAASASCKVQVLEPGQKITVG
jgi:L-ascorbate metabolism protein UlaG (beta-lactamase superfamily)